MRDTTESLDAITAALRAAECAGVAAALVTAAKGDIAALVGLVDARRLATFELGRRIVRLKARGLERAQILERLNINAHQYRHALRRGHDSSPLSG